MPARRHQKTAVATVAGGERTRNSSSPSAATHFAFPCLTPPRLSAPSVHENFRGRDSASRASTRKGNKRLTDLVGQKEGKLEVNQEIFEFHLVGGKHKRGYNLL